MFAWFENRLTPFPEAEPTQPPSGFVAFCWYYAKDAAPWLVLMAICTALISVGEVLLFGFLGSIVDWLSHSDPDGFLTREGWRLAGMGFLVLVGLPVIVLLQSMLIHQTLLPNFPMIARWQMHRYLLRQSFAFFANEFAGRVATRVMQTSLAIRESVMKMLDVFVYVAVYFVAMIVMVASADWRLALPIVAWAAIYAA
ncbi:MAG TPA: ABC transporter transmembrane domain-containing protein, partial [Pararhizobium sp.]|nr:ABC transporter transmembrane domain-containing protein [Pararhizobium sp.]